MSGASIPVVIALAVFGLAGGIGISAVGPGGVLPTIGLFALTDMSPAAIAGTAIVTHVATGLAGSAVYWRSGQLRDERTRSTAITLAAVAAVATPLGVLANSMISKRVFGLGLAVFAIGIGMALHGRGRASAGGTSTRRYPSRTVVMAVGALVALVAGLAGLGGPMLCVPVLAVLGVPMLEALAAAQAQSVVVAGVGTLGYAVSGSIDWPLAVAIGVPEVVGVVIGWKIARSVPDGTLRRSLVVVLFSLTPLLVLRG